MSADEDRWRIFCAVELPEEVRRRVTEHAARLRDASPHARAGWERAEKLHVTLKFIGGVERASVPRLSSAVGKAAASVPPFSLTLGAAGAFPPRGLPRVLWLGLTDGAGELARLQSLLEDECARANFAREARAFHQHLTIARLRSAEGARELAARHKEAGFAGTTFVVREVVVMRSELGRGSGSRYTALSRHHLGQKLKDES